MAWHDVLRILLPSLTDATEPVPATSKVWKYPMLLLVCLYIDKVAMLGFIMIYLDLKGVSREVT